MNKSGGFPEIKLTRKNGTEQIQGDPEGKTLSDFWQWSFSDLLGNTARGIFAEYLVAHALGLTANHVRDEWRSYDLETEDGKTKIEVKSFSPYQPWPQKELSRISFTIRPTRAWHQETGELDPVTKHQADIYVFCVLGDREEFKNSDRKTVKEKVDPMKLDQWDFYVVKTSDLKKKFPKQKTIGKTSFEELHTSAVKYADIKRTVDRLR